MPINCVVDGCCRNQNNSPESSFYRFPSDSSCQRLWVRFVDNTRSDFVRTQNSRVCSAHFVHGDFEPSSLLKRKFGIARTRLLIKPGAVPCTCTCSFTCTRTRTCALYDVKWDYIALAHVDYFPVQLSHRRLWECMPGERLVKPHDIHTAVHGEKVVRMEH